MKKLVLSFLLTLIATSAIAQKSYLRIVDHGDSTSGISLSGDIPAGIKGYYGGNFTENHIAIGTLLNLLVEEGFNVEFMAAATAGSSPLYVKTIYLLSRVRNAEPPVTTSIESISGDSDSDISEVARYNLQGVPVNKNDKGLQIIVYSNYTTKAIIQE